MNKTPDSNSNSNGRQHRSFAWVWEIVVVLGLIPAIVQGLSALSSAPVV